METIGNDIRSLEELVSRLDLEVDGWTVEAIRECEETLASMEAILEEQSELNDSSETSSFEEVTLKKEKKSIILTYSNRVAAVSCGIDGRRTAQAEIKKNSGNDEFKKGNFAAALEMYKKAIDYDPSNAVYYTNRALVLQKMDDWFAALSDAEYAVGLDAGMLKAHIILMKCQVNYISPPYHFVEKRSSTDN
jgi:tetratricopeptide (TPR) repeat protein